MAPKSASHTPGRFQISKNCYGKICWARLPEKGNAMFSMQIEVDGNVIQTVNSLTLRDSTERESGEKVVHIGSMSNRHDTARGEKVIYSNTFFPGSNGDKAQDQVRRDFVNNVIKAVTEFLASQAENEKRRQELMTQPNPALQNLVNLRETLHFKR